MDQNSYNPAFTRYGFNKPWTSQLQMATSLLAISMKKKSSKLMFFLEQLQNKTSSSNICKKHPLMHTIMKVHETDRYSQKRGIQEGGKKGLITIKAKSPAEGYQMDKYMNSKFRKIMKNGQGLLEKIKVIFFEGHSKNKQQANNPSY